MVEVRLSYVKATVCYLHQGPVKEGQFRFVHAGLRLIKFWIRKMKVALCATSGLKKKSYQLCRLAKEKN